MVDIKIGGGIYCIRHAQTAYNKGGANTEDRIRGWLNIGLNAEGRAEAEQVAKEVKSLPIEKILSSDLDRAIETAKAISEAIHIPISVKSKDFRPWHLGIYQGELTKDVQPHIKYLAEKEPDTPAPEGESFHQFANRVTTAFRRLMQAHKEGRLQTSLIVTHYRDTKLLMAWINSKGDKKKFFDIFFSDDLATGAIMRVYPTPNGWDAEMIDCGNP